MIDSVKEMSNRTEISQYQIVNWLEIPHSKYYNWSKRYAKLNEHNGLVQRDWWLEPWKKDVIIRYFINNPTEVYRRLSYMMLDKYVVALSPASIYRVLRGANLIGKPIKNASFKGKGFQQPLKALEHCHTDVTYLILAVSFTTYVAY